MKLARKYSDAVLDRFAELRKGGMSAIEAAELIQMPGCAHNLGCAVGRRRQIAEGTLPKRARKRDASGRSRAGVYATRGAKPSERKCLGCPRTFYSSGIHHRICDCCKATETWREMPDFEIRV